jgi:hypothetical protein
VRLVLKPQTTCKLQIIVSAGNHLLIFNVCSLIAKYEIDGRYKWPTVSDSETLQQLDNMLFFYPFAAATAILCHSLYIPPNRIG